MSTSDSLVFSILERLQRVYCKNELFTRLEFLLGKPETSEEGEGYYEDVDELINIFLDAVASFYETEAKKCSPECLEKCKREKVVAELYIAINQKDAAEVDSNNNHNDNNNNDDENDTISRSSVEWLYEMLDGALSTAKLRAAMADGVVALATREKREREEEERKNNAKNDPTNNNNNNNNNNDAPERSGVKVSAEEKFRLAQLVRSGLLDEAELLILRDEDEEEEAVELRAEEPMFLRGLGVYKKSINYKSLLPSQQLMRASTATQRQNIMSRLLNKDSENMDKMNSLEIAAKKQEDKNKLRQILRARERRANANNPDAADPNDDPSPTNSKDMNGKNGLLGEGAALSSSAANRSAGLLETELEEKHEERGFRSTRDLPSRLPPWMKHNFGYKPSFGLRPSFQTISEQRQTLPIYKFKSALLDHVRSNPVTIVIGETGSGKTTQLPQYLAEDGYNYYFNNDGGTVNKANNTDNDNNNSSNRAHKIIVCTQPRRVAAETLAARVAEEYGCRLGEEVGYSVRFKDVTSSLTKIKYMTDGMLLREALLDSAFQRYSVIMLDEAHERSINTDILFVLVREALKKRDDLKVIVTSATLEKEKFCAYFNTKSTFFIEGRTFPVETYFLESPADDYLDTALRSVMMIHVQEPPGDVLVFLTGQEEIELAGERLFSWIKRIKKSSPLPVPDLLILPLTATLPQEVQSKVFDPTPPGSRKIILATNVAETSITIDNLFFVVDTGFCKQNIFNFSRKIEELKIMPISQAQARQRSGRAGRIGPGKCFRLYTESQFFNELATSTVPDIQRANLFQIVLQLKALNVQYNINSSKSFFMLDFMDPPPKKALIWALEKLAYIGALDEEGCLTALGGRMALLPLDPSQSKTLLTAVDLGCTDSVLTMIAMLSVQKKNVFYRPKASSSLENPFGLEIDSNGGQNGSSQSKHHEFFNPRQSFYQPQGDHFTLKAVYEAWLENSMSESWCRQYYLKQSLLLEARDTREQLSQMLKKRYANFPHGGENDVVAISKSFTSGYFLNAARRIHQDVYVTLSERQEVFIHPTSVLREDPPKYVLFDEVQRTTKEYMREVLSIESSWLVELAPAYYAKPKKGQLTREQRAQHLTPILKSWETGSSWRISKQRRR